MWHKGMDHPGNWANYVYSLQCVSMLVKYITELLWIYFPYLQNERIVILRSFPAFELSKTTSNVK